MVKNYDLRLKGFVGYWDFDSDYVDYILDKFADRKVDVLIDSTGGQLASALSISAAFKNHGDVHVHFVSLNASAATIASLGAKVITMDSHAHYLVHRCSAYICSFDNLNAEQIEAKCQELQKTKADLEKFDISIAAAYARRCKKSVEELHALMAKNTWLTAEEALAWGFIDEITDFDEDPEPVLDDVTALAFAQNGIPVPAALQRKQTESSFANRILSKFGTRSKTKISHKNVKPSNNSSVMNQKNEGTGTDTAQPVAEDTSKDVIAAKNDEIKKLKDRIAALEKEPADSHKSVVESPKADNSPQSDYVADMKKAVDLFKSLP